MRPRSPLPGYTVSADLIQGLIDCALRSGVPRVGVARPVAGSKSTLQERYSLKLVLDLWARLVRISQDPVIGFRMALVATPKTFGVLGQVLPHCATLLDAYGRIERYSGIASQGARVSVSSDESRLILSVSAKLPKGAVESNVMLWGLTNLSLLPQRLVGPGAPRPIAVECAFPSPGADVARALREKLPFRFDATTNRVLFRASVGELRVPTANEDMRKLVSQVIEQRLSELRPPDDFEIGLATILRSMVNGTMPTLAALSAHVGLSQRTLQRRLTESKTSFQRLLRQVLREVADELLARGTVSQGEIAFLLGYSEVSAFSHAYRSWTGHAPGTTYVRSTTRR